MDNAPPEEVLTGEAVVNNEEVNNDPLEDVPADSYQPNFKHEAKERPSVDMPTLENLQAPITASEITEAETKIEPIPNSIEVPENTTEIAGLDVTETSSTELVTDVPEITNTVENPETAESDVNKAEENIEAVCNVEFPESNTTVSNVEYQLTVEEFTVQNESGDQNTLESVIEAENAVAQIITPDDPPTESNVAEVENLMLVENDINFGIAPNDSVEGSNSVDASFAEETNTSSVISNVQYHVVLNDNQTDNISVNGMHQLTKEDVDLYETEAVIKMDTESTFDSQTLTDVVTISGSTVQSQDGTIMSLSSDTVTFTDVQMLSEEGVVTINEISEQSEEQVVILPDEQVVLMETQEYDHPESIEVNVLEDKGDEGNEEDFAVESDEPKPLNIPCHVLGRSIENPLEDPVKNGKVLLKPRLGVKIPYRNLTSQIVSKQEIAEEIMERSRLRQSTAEPPVGGDVFFAKKLTQRLAKKLVPSSKPSSKSKTSASTSSSSSSSLSSIKKSSNPKTTSVTKSETIVATAKIETPTKIPEPKVVTPKPQASTVVNPKPQASAVVLAPTINSNKTPALSSNPKLLDMDKITDNSDLIALLEGDDVPDWTIGMKSHSTSISQSNADGTKRSTDWERETALKQLRELPKQVKGVQKYLPKTDPLALPPQNSNKEPVKLDQPDPLDISVKDSTIQEKDEMNIESRFSSTMGLKTYTRKRKLYEDIKPSSSSSSAQKKSASEAQKQPPTLSPLKSSPPTVHKQPPVLSPQKSPSTTSTVQKSSTSASQKSSATSQKPATTSNVEKSAITAISQKTSASPVTPTSQKSSSSSQKPLQKPSSNSQKLSSSTITPKPSLSASTQKTSSSPSIQKQPSTSVAAKTRKPSVEEKKQPVEEKKQPVEEKKPTIKSPATPEPEEATPFRAPKKNLSPNTYISKSSRIVKRKKIWDPDEAIPAFKVKKEVFKSVSPEKTVEKKVKPVAVLKPSNEKSPTKVSEKTESVVLKARVGRPPTVVKTATIVKSAMGRPTVLKAGNEKLLKKVMVKKGIIKKKRPKRLTEVDRLLMDEGAVNLLYSVKNTDELQGMNRKKKKKTLISLDKAQRELQNKTNEIKNDLQINSTKDSPINLRKKEGAVTPKASPLKDLAATVLHRKKSKDSMSGSVHSPPASPGFAYAQHAEASRIIRRHSSSSFSSEDTDGDESSEESTEKKPKREPQKKKKVNHEKQKGSIGVDKQLLNEEMAKNFNRLPSDDPKYSEFETFSVRKFDNLVQIILASTTSNGQTTLSIQVLIELAEVLAVLQKDNTCRVVVISSSGNSFCQGIDYKELASDDKEARQNVAEEYALCVREFLAALAKFSKILVAGVHGNTIGLGVTMLPLFDMVLASDTATFSTPYTRLGCAVEGGVLLTLPHVMHNALASELFFASRKLTAAEALRLGLVTRTLWPDKFQEELISALKIISGQSLQSMQAIKKQLRHHLLSNVEVSLKSESSTLIQHWTSNECQINFSSYSLDSK